MELVSISFALMMLNSPCHATKNEPFSSQ